MKHRESDESLRPIREYYEAGHTVRETAEHFGVTIARVNYLAKSRRWTNGRSFKEHLNDDNLRRIREKEHEVLSRLLERGLMLIGSWKGKRYKYSVLDLYTGEIFERSGLSLLGSRGKPAISHYKRAMEFGCECELGINLDELIHRLGTKCIWCGKECNRNDKRWGNYGPDYPTIDHVVPLSKGGTHTWDNVKVACGYCNTHKSNKDIKEIKFELGKKVSA